MGIPPTLSLNEVIKAISCPPKSQEFLFKILKKLLVHKMKIVQKRKEKRVTDQTEM